MAHQPFSQAERVARLLARMQNVPQPVARAVAEAVVEGTLKGRGAPAALERFYGALAAAGRIWANGRGIALDDAFCPDFAEVFLRYLLVERGITPRSAADYFERIEGFAYRGQLFDRAAAEAFADIRGQLRAEAED